MSGHEIGCCGAFCGRCREMTEGRCPGCTVGYETGDRDIAKAKCKIKVCCIGKLGNSCSCADCTDFPRCKVLQDFYGKTGYKYRKYNESLEFIRANGYANFQKFAKKWKRPYGSLMD
jgi:hypothetical protein